MASVTIRFELDDGDYIDDDGNVRNDLGQVIFDLSSHGQASSRLQPGDGVS